MKQNYFSVKTLSFTHEDDSVAFIVYDASIPIHFTDPLILHAVLALDER